MLEYFKSFIYLFNDNTIFFFCAFLGSGLLFIQFILNLIDLTDHEDFEDSEVGHERKFKWLSIQAISGFLMMFGWTAITCQKEFNFQTEVTIVLSVIAGLFTVFITHLIFKIAKKLQSTGSIYRIEDAIGKEAYVYQRIPKDGVGKISISFQHFTHEIDAISNTQEELSSFTRVQIIKKKDDNTVVVIAIP